MLRLVLRLAAALFAFAAVALASSLAHAQLVRDHVSEGGVRGFHGTGPLGGIRRSFQADTEARAELDRILAAVGLKPMGERIVLRASAETANAEAGISADGRERFIFYNADFMQRLKQRTAEQWTLVSILAHELGHHLAFHTEIAGHDHEFEFEADQFSGFVLRRLGATLDQAQAAMRAISPKEATATHPGLEQRLQMITIGWTDAGSQGAPRGLNAGTQADERTATLEPAATPPTPAQIAAKPQPASPAEKAALAGGNPLESGNFAMNRGDYDRAIALYTKALEINPKYGRAYFNRGLSYGRKHDDVRAIADYTRAIQIDPSYADAYFSRAAAFGRKGDNDRAIADFTRTIELAPKASGAYFNRGLAYENRGDDDRAIADFTKVMELEPRSHVAYYNRGNAYSRRGDYDRAIVDFTKAVEINPKYARAYNNRGSAYNRRGDYDQAMADFTKAIEIEPRAIRAYYNRGNAYGRRGDYERAIAEYSRAIEIDPRYAAAYTSRGNAYSRRGNHDRAIADFTRAIEIDPIRVLVA